MATKAKKKPAVKAKPAAVKNKKAVKAKVVKPPQKGAKPAKKTIAKKAAPKKVVKAKPVAKAAKKAASKVKPVIKVKAKVAAKPAPKATKKPEVKKPVAKVATKATPVKGAKEEVKVSATAAIKHVEKHLERPSRRRSRGGIAFVKPALPPRTTPLRVDPILPNTPVKSSLKKPVAMLNNNNAKPSNSPDKTRYSDSELAEFRELIVQKVSDAKSELVNLQTLLNNSDTHGTDDTASSFKMLEDGSDTLAKEEAGQLAARQRKFIEQLENALVRIENKTYGVCRVTGKLIPKERLRAVPHTTQSIEAKVQQYRD